MAEMIIKERSLLVIFDANFPPPLLALNFLRVKQLKDNPPKKKDHQNECKYLINFCNEVKLFKTF